jgi:hypothetical protein
LIGFGVAILIADVCELLPGQISANLQAVDKSLGNAGKAVTTFASCAYDYTTSLVRLDYPSKEYAITLEECHQRSAAKLFKLAQRCDGAYNIAGQFIF